MYCFAQLLPSIGLNVAPNDADSICPIITAQGAGAVPGFMPGDTVPDFKLYTLNGDSVQLSQVLQQGIPVLLISSSYTCPVFRGKINNINQVDSIYQGQLAVYIIYTVEAHPDIDVSPYSGNVWTTSSNVSAGILYRQPKTYGERKVVIDSLLSNNYIRPDILLDGPCNEWWSNYGTEPNSATLIRPNGKVFTFQKWFNKAPENIFCEIDSLLNTNSGLCNMFGNGGTFSLVTDSTANDVPGSVLSIHATINNLSSTENVVVNIQRGTAIMPSTWLTALCTDVCYPPSTNSVQVTIPPSATQTFIFYFYTDSILASGMAPVRFRNANMPSNEIIQRYYGSTLSTGITTENLEVVELYPNPTSGMVFIEQDKQYEWLIILDAIGKFISRNKLNEFGSTAINVNSFPPGVYYFQLEGRNRIVRKLIKY